MKTKQNKNIYLEPTFDERGEERSEGTELGWRECRPLAAGVEIYEL